MNADEEAPKDLVVFFTEGLGPPCTCKTSTITAPHWMTARGDILLCYYPRIGWMVRRGEKLEPDEGPCREILDHCLRWRIVEHLKGTL